MIPEVIPQYSKELKIMKNKKCIWNENPILKTCAISMIQYQVHFVHKISLKYLQLIENVYPNVKCVLSVIVILNIVFD